MQTLLFPIRQDALDFDPYSPGLSIDEVREKYALPVVIKMASNENPLGTSPLAQARIRATAANAFRYAQAGNPRLVAALAASLGVPAHHIVTGNGSDEIIDLLIRVCPTPGVHSIVASKPSFSMYQTQSKLCGVTFRQVSLNSDFSFNFDGLRAAIDTSTALVFLTTPDNPSGHCPTKKEILNFVRSVPASCLVVVDEAYIEFCTLPGTGTVLHEVPKLPNLAVLRTFSKFYGLAGLRLGYGIMPAILADRLWAVHPPFSINILAEEAGLAALEDTAFHQATFQAVIEGRHYLTEALAAIGCHPYPSQANFIMFRLPDSSLLRATDIFEKLLSRGIIIRPLKSYAIPEMLRVSVGTTEENKAFILAIEEILRG